MKGNTLNNANNLYLNDQLEANNNFCSDFSIDKNIQVSNREELAQDFLSEMISIFLVTEGYGKIYLNSKEVELNKNSLIQIPQNTLVTTLEQDTKVYLSGVRFSSDFVSDIRVPKNVLGVFNHFSYNFLSVISLDEKEASFIDHQIGKLNDYRERCRSHIFGRELLINSFQEFLMKTGGLIQQYSEVMELNHSPQDCLYIKFSNLVHRQFKEDRIIKNYADQLNVTPKYLGEVVKERSGKNASTIIRDLVTSEAKYLLSNPELNISQVAEILNFSDVSIFGKYFKNETGLSPKQYKAKKIFS